MAILARPDGKAFNTAFFTDAKGRILARYHKQVLLAFGEYLPFAKLLSWIPNLPFADGFTPGPGPVVFHLPAVGSGSATNLLRRSDARLGAQVCQ